MADSEEFSNLFNHLMDPIPNHSSSSFTFSDPSSSFYPIPNPNPHPHPPHHSPSTQNAEASELPSKAVPPPRSSSKRSRAAEFHNLSEKRRRSKINEKMKALQNLIPNSNKTDKASMLDEAIEYLKQLQLQVQMLMMRNGFSLHPMSSSGGPRSMMLAETGLNLDETNGFQNSISAIVSSANDESLVRPSYSFPEQCSISNQSIVIPSMTNISTLDASSSFQPSIKDAFCGNMPQLFLDATRMGKLPSPDVS